MSTAEEPRGIAVEPVTRFITDSVDGAVAPYRYELIAAGGSNLTFRVTDAAGHQWALRRPPVGHALPTAHDMGREWRIMAALGENSDVPVPDCIAYCADHDVNGADFYLMSFVEGAILRDAESSAQMSRDEAAIATESLIDVQVRLHTLDLDAVGLGDLGKREDYVGRQLKRWKGQVERGGVRDLPLMVELHDLLVDAKPTEKAPPALAHGDYRFDNTVLGADGRVAAVLDWELCTTGNPIADFAWSLQYWADPQDEMTWLTSSPTVHDTFIGRDDVVRRYGELTGFDLSDLDYYTAFSWWKQACIVEGAYARRLAGATGGMSSSGDVHDIGRRVDAMLDHARSMTTRW